MEICGIANEQVFVNAQTIVSLPIPKNRGLIKKSSKREKNIYTIYPRLLPLYQLYAAKSWPFNQLSTTYRL